MKKVIVLAGSNSSTSINKQLVKYAGSLTKNAEIEYLALEDYEPPMFSTDLENEIGSHQTIKDLVAKFDGADGLIISTPEHNSMPPAFFKNILDWLSRTGKTILDGRAYLENKPVLLMSAGPGGGGAKGAQDLVAKMLGFANAKITGRFSFPGFYKNFNEDKIVNEELKSELSNLVMQFEDAI